MKERARVFFRRLRREANQPKWRKSKGVRWAIGIVLTLAVAALFPRAHSSELSGYSVGSLWTNEEVTAPFSFPILKETSRYRRDVQKSLEKLYPVFVPIENARDQALDTLHNVWLALSSRLLVSTLDSVRQYKDSLRAGLTAEEFESLYTNTRVNRAVKLSELEATLVKVLTDVEDNTLISGLSVENSVINGTRFVSIRRHNNEELVLDKSALLTVEAAQNRVFSLLEKKFTATPVFERALAKIASTSVAPNVSYSPERTAENRVALENQVLRTDGTVVVGQHIIGKGEVVTPAAKAALESLAQARLERGGVTAQIALLLGTIGHVAIIILLVVLYLRFIRRRIYKDNAQLLLLSIILYFPAVLAYLSVRVQVNFPLEYFILIPVTSMLLTILFDSRTGFYGTVVAALVVAGIRGNDYSVALAGLTAGAFAAYTVRDLRSRSQLFQSIGYVFLGYLVAIVALSLEKGTPLDTLGFELIAALGNALISPVLTFGVLYMVEMIFDTVSDLRLTEFDNINHPLMRELALRAPGTYQHTMLVSQLAENAAIAIGANALLAKVGAFFHDIGKLTEPTDFIENQAGENGNIHDVITPLESAKRVRRHVTEGIDLARAHNIPEKLVDFVPMHHGTLRISFFYDRALQQGFTGGVMDDEMFRYPGPKPTSKETAIVMLADVAEAVARTVVSTVAEPTYEMFEESIERLVRARFDDGQLDNCDLTIRDLTVIRSVFARLLAGLHHTRIAYPTLDAAQLLSQSVLESKQEEMF